MDPPAGFARGAGPLVTVDRCWGCRRAARAAFIVEVVGLCVAGLCDRCAARPATRRACQETLRARLDGWPVLFIDAARAREALLG